MEQVSSRVFTDDTVSSAVLDVIREAKDHVILVSPYNKFWDHLKNEIRLAIKRGVRLVVVYRDGENSDDISWLGSEGATVYAVDKLHAKVFLNETSLILTSMNLLDVSSKNSREIALRMEDGVIKAEIRDYVLQRLIPLGHQVYPKPAGAEKPSAAPRTNGSQQAKPTTRRPKASDAPAKGSSTVFGKVLDTLKMAVAGGRCIRCNAGIGYDPNRPLCDECFMTWNRYKDPDYQERYCHKCGRERDTSYAKPLCRTCYQAAKA